MIKQNLNTNNYINKTESDNFLPDVYIEKNQDNQYVYKVEIKIGDFKPNDIRLRLKGRKLIIHAVKQANKTVKYDLKHNNNLSINELRNLINDSKTNAINNEYEEFKKEIILPNFVRAETILSFLETYEDKTENLLLLEGQIDTDLLESDDMTTTTTTRKFPTNNLQKNKNTNDYLDECNQMENHSSGVLKYKFDLKDFDSSHVNISIKNKEILVISASNGTIKDFYREIRLPKNSEIHNIRNCFDESVGILRIEIPLTKKKNQNNSDLNNLDEKNKSSRDKRTVNDDKYLELVFDLHDYQFDKIDVQKNENNKNILIVKAFRLNNLDANIDDWSDINDKNSFFRKYVLPDWVSPKNIKIFEEKKLINGEKKNLLILNLPFI